MSALITAALACTGSPAGAAPAAAMPAAGPPLVGGVARTPEEVARCRQEETTRIGGDRRGRVPPPAEPVRLRSQPVDLPEDGCEAAAKRYNFYLDGNEQGCFVNAFRGSGGTLVADLATRLVWRHVPPLRPRTFQQAKQAVASLNTKRADGHSDWRLPTTEELLSILETPTSETSHFDSGLFGTEIQWWSADYGERGRIAWSVLTSTPHCWPSDAHDRDLKLHVLAVRSMRDGETFDEEADATPPQRGGTGAETPRRPAR